MSTATMTSKGQITIPKHIRDDLNLAPGSKVLFVKLGERDYRMIARTGKASDLAGMLHRPGQRTLSIEEINEGIAEGGAVSGMRGVRPEDDNEE